MKIKSTDNVFFWVACALLVVCLSIWIAGPFVKFGQSNIALFAPPAVRLALITAVLAAWGCYNGWRWRRLERDTGPSETPNREATSKNRTRLTFRQELKRSGWLTKAKPRYLVIGPSHSGKTTALQCFAGVASPSTPAAGLGTEPRHCQRLASGQAELIDMRGSLFDLTGQAEDETLWRDMLRLLFRRPMRRPLQGILVVLSVADLLAQTGREESAAVQTALATRLRDLTRQSKYRLPVYVVFTKTDLVKGFSEFFDDLDRSVGAEPWGFALPTEACASDAKLLQALGDQFDALSSGIHWRLVPRLESESDANRRAALHAFPQAVTEVFRRAERLLAESFARAGETRAPLLRGVYFGSAFDGSLHEGETIDPIVQALPIDLGYSPASLAAPNGRTRAYFLGQFLHEVLLADRHWLRYKLRTPVSRPWLARAAATVATTIMLVMGGIWTFNLYQHKDRIHSIGRDLQEVAQSNPDGGLVYDLMQLQSLDATINRAQSRHQGVLAGLALADARPEEALRRLYRSMLMQRLLPRLIVVLESEIAEQQTFEALTAAVRIYRMFERPDKMRADEVVQWFAARASLLLPSNEQLHQPLMRHVAALVEVPLPAMRANRALVQQASDKLQHIPMAETVYARMQQAALTQGAPLELLADAAAREFFVSAKGSARAQVDHLYTKRGFAELDLTPDSQWLRDLAPDDWVWQGYRAGDSGHLAHTLSAQVKALYYRDFIAAWDAAWAGLSISPFEDLHQAERMLALGSDPVHSPILKLLQLGAANTRLSALGDVSAVIGMSPESRAKGLAKQVAENAAGITETEVDRHFRALHDTVDAPNSGALAALLDQLAAAHALVVAVNHGGNPGQAAFAAVSARYAGGANAISNLRVSARTLPEPARSWVGALADQSWAVLIRVTRNHLNQQWHARVYRPYAGSLKGRYPLAGGVDIDATLYDFNQFFKPEGVLDLGLEQLLKPFLDTRGEWRNREVDGRSLALSRRALSQLQELKTLQRLLYRNSPEMPRVTLELKPVAMVERDARFALDLGAQTVEYRHGPKLWQRLDWQATNENPMARVTFEGLNGVVQRREYAGVWSLFRLFDEAKMTDLGQSNRFLATLNVHDGEFRPITGGAHQAHEIVLEVKSQSAEAPFRPDLFSSIELPEWL